jgi:glyoxylase-like metal-dependent hydrolase (beta-lactamase superfamily II)
MHHARTRRGSDIVADDSLGMRSGGDSMRDARSLGNVRDAARRSRTPARRRLRTSFGTAMAALRVAAATLGITLLSGSAFGQQPTQAPSQASAQPPAHPRALIPLDELRKSLPPMGPIQQLADNLYLIPGQGCNTAVWVHAHGVLIVDTKFPGNAPDLLKLIRTITDKPVTHIVNTHFHADHSGSNAEFPADVEIIAQENAAAHMRNMPRFQSEAGRVGLPDRTFAQRLTLFEGKDTVELYHFGPAHTGGDTWVVFPSAHVAFSGDVPKKKEFPTVDREGGGSGVQFFHTLSATVAAITGVDRVVGGHSPQIMTWNDVVDFTELSRLMLEHETAAYRAGKSPEQTLAEFDPPARFKDFSRIGSAFGGVDAVRATFAELAESGTR